jgi:hypothetical protein
VEFVAQGQQARGFQADHRHAAFDIRHERGHRAFGFGARVVGIAGR